MTIHYKGHGVTLHHGDCLDVLRTLPDASVDSVVTDPPYNLSFMGKGWDTFPIRKRGQGGTGINSEHAGGVEFKASAEASHAFQQWCEMWATECLRVLKPGGHLLAFGGTRTWHRLACAVEDAGFEVRDSIAWMYGSGFPKSLDVSKAIDKAAGALAHESVGFTVAGRTDKNLPNPVVKGYTPPAPATPDAERWQGWGTALKPAFEPVVVARKPLSGTVAATVLAHGTGALNIDGCRVNPGESVPGGGGFKGGASSRHEGWTRPSHTEGAAIEAHTAGRWPANVVLDESQAAALDEQSGEGSPKPARTGRKGGCSDNGTMTGYGTGDDVGTWPADAGGGASRFFYVAKADASERPRYTRPKLRLRDDLTPAQVDHVRARLAEAGVQVD